MNTTAIKTTNHIPAGVYTASLEMIEPYANNYGDRLRFYFLILEGEQRGNIVTHTTTAGMNSTKCKLYEVLKGLIGRDLSANELAEGFDPADLVGTRCHIVAVDSQNRSGSITYTDISHIFRLN